MKIINNSRSLTLFIPVLVIVGNLLLSVPLHSQEKTLDDQANEISNSLLCPVCQGQSVAESNSNLANDMRQVIRKKLEQGQSREEIVAYFVDTYGEGILGAPPAKGVNLFLWVLPALAIVFGLFGIGIFLYRAGSDNEERSERAQESQAKSGDPYLERIDEELNNDT